MFQLLALPGIQLQFRMENGGGEGDHKTMRPLAFCCPNWAWLKLLKILLAHSKNFSVIIYQIFELRHFTTIMHSYAHCYR